MAVRVLHIGITDPSTEDLQRRYWGAAPPASSSDKLAPTEVTDVEVNAQGDARTDTRESQRGNGLTSDNNHKNTRDTEKRGGERGGDRVNNDNFIPQVCM
jgi:hypothetical protein